MFKNHRYIFICQATIRCQSEKNKKTLKRRGAIGSFGDPADFIVIFVKEGRTTNVKDNRDANEGLTAHNLVDKESFGRSHRPQSSSLDQLIVGLWEQRTLLKRTRELWQRQWHKKLLVFCSFHSSDRNASCPSVFGKTPGTYLQLFCAHAGVVRPGFRSGFRKADTRTKNSWKT